MESRMTIFKSDLKIGRIHISLPLLSLSLSFSLSFSLSLHAALQGQGGAPFPARVGPEDVPAAV